MLRSVSFLTLGLSLVALAACQTPSPDGGVPDGPGGSDAIVADVLQTDILATDSSTDAGLQCGDVGTVTTPLPAPSASPTSDFNVTANACTRTGVALQCELGVAHQYGAVIDGTVRRIRANGVPNHDVGAFPNPGNPNAISAQVYNYAVPVTPSGPGAESRVFGVTVSGAVLDPGTAEVWNDSSSWNYEALRYATAPAYFSGATATDRTMHPSSLGVDCNLAHVQPNGSYHYHGIPTGLMPSAPALTFVGWAGDGYPIFARWGHATPTDGASPMREMRGSFRLKTGTRPSGTAGPGGAYDGTFRQDWEYVAGLGDLDECNGRTGVVTVEGAEVTTYHYVLTYTYPYIPRCFHSAPHASFSPTMMGPMGDGGIGPMGDGGAQDATMAMGPRACTATSECTGACPAGSMGCTCATTMGGGMGCVPTCRVAADCPANGMGPTFLCRAGICVP